MALSLQGSGLIIACSTACWAAAPSLPTAHYCAATAIQVRFVCGKYGIQCTALQGSPVEEATGTCFEWLPASGCLPAFVH